MPSTSGYAGGVPEHSKGMGIGRLPEWTLFKRDYANDQQL